MLAKDIMSEGILTVSVEATLHEAAERLVNAHVSAMPVVDGRNTVVGIVSEADLIRRIGDGQAQPESLLLRRLADDMAGAAAFVRSHSRRVGDVMTRNVVMADEDTTVGEIAAMMVRHNVKRVPITRRDQLVGMVSRIDLLQALISHGGGERPDTSPAQPLSDDELRTRVHDALSGQGWAASWPADVVASAGTVHLWGVVPDNNVRDAYRVAVEAIPGVQSVALHMHVVPATARGRLPRRR